MIRLYLGLGLVAALLLALVAAWFIGGQAARNAAERDRLRDNIGTRERIDDATSGPRTPGDINDRLRDLAK